MMWRPGGTGDSSSIASFSVAFDPSQFATTPTYDQINNYRNSGSHLFTTERPAIEYYVQGCTNENSNTLNNDFLDCVQTWPAGQFAIAPMFAASTSIYYTLEWMVEYSEPRNL